MDYFNDINDLGVNSLVDTQRKTVDYETKLRTRFNGLVEITKEVFERYQKGDMRTLTRLHPLIKHYVREKELYSNTQFKHIFEEFDSIMDPIIYISNKRK